MKKSIVILNSSDSLFSEIRDRNFHGINQVLSRTAKELQQANDVFFLFHIIYHAILREKKILIIISYRSKDEKPLK